MAEVSRKEKVWGVVPRSEKRDGWHSIYKLIQFLMRPFGTEGTQEPKIPESNICKNIFSGGPACTCILMEVLHYLGAKHLCVLAAVLKDWRKMAEDKQLWHEMCKRYTRVDWNSLPPPPPGYDSRMLIRAPWKALYLRSEKILKKWVGGKSVKTVKLLEGGPEDCQPGQTVLVSATHLFSVPNKHRHCIDVWALDTAKYLHRLAGHKGPVEIVELSESGPLLASSAVDDTILRVWDINTAHCLLKLQHTECPKFRLHGQRLIVADKVEHDIREHLDCEIVTDNWGRCESFKLHVYDLQTGLKIKSVCGIDGEGEVMAMEFNEDYLVTGHGYSNLSLPKIKVWDHDLNCLKTWTHNQNFESHRIMLDKASSTIITYDHELCPVCPVHEPCSVIVWSMEGVMKSRVLTMPKGSINQMHVHVAVIANRVFVYISKQKHTDIIKVLKLPSGWLLQEIVAGSIESRQLFFKYHTATLLQTYPICYHQIFVHLFLPLYLNDLYEDELTEEQNKDDAKKKRKRKLARKISSKVDAMLAGAMLMRSYMIKGAADIYAYIQRVVRAFPWSVLGFPKARNAERNEREENENGYSDSDDSSDNISTDGSDGSSADDEGSDADDEQGNIEQAQAQDQILAFYRREEHAHPYVQQMFLPGGDNAADLRERGVPVHDARGGDDDGHIDDNGDNIRPVVERVREFNREMRRAGMRDRDLERLVGEGDVEINLEEDEHDHHEHACFDRMHIKRTQLYFFLKPRKEDYDNYFRKFITLDYNCPFPHPL